MLFLLPYESESPAILPVHPPSLNRFLSFGAPAWIEAEALFLSEESHPFTFKTLRAEWDSGSKLREGPASVGLPFLESHPQLLSDPGLTLWIPQASNWGLGEPAAFADRVARLVRRHPSLHLVLPWPRPQVEAGPLALTWTGSEWNRVRKTNALLLAQPDLIDRLIPTENLVYQLGYAQIFDPRWKHAAQMPWTSEFQEQLARHILRFLDLRKNGPMKVLAVDFDNTLWPGALSEDEIRLEPGTVLGEAFLDFQREILELKNRGILLVGLTKNDPDQVNEHWQKAQGMLLKETDFAAVHANWGRKSGNLLQAARELNLSPEHFGFVDDDAAEVALMRTDLPQVRTLHLHADPSWRLLQLREQNWFWSFHLTEEDRIRVSSARPPATDFSPVQSAQALDELNIRVDLQVLAEADLPRVHQLVQKTNQFNLTTERWDLQTLHAKFRSGTHRIFTYRVQDRFGPLGLVGVFFLRTDGPDIEIENWIMSCRAFSREVEARAWILVAAHFPLKNFRTRWVPSGRNRVALDHLVRLGFQPRPDGDAVDLRYEPGVIPAFAIGKDL